MKKILLLALLIAASTAVVVAGVNSAIQNKDNAAQAVHRGERIKVKLKEMSTNTPCPENTATPGGQALAYGGEYTPEELAKFRADVTSGKPKTEVKPGGQAVAYGGEYSKEELEKFDKEFNPEKHKNATPTPPCVKPVKKDDKRPNSVIRFIKRFMGTTPAHESSGN